MNRLNQIRPFITSSPLLDFMIIRFFFSFNRFFSSSDEPQEALLPLQNPNVASLHAQKRAFECGHHCCEGERKRTKPRWFRMSPFIRQNLENPKLGFKWDCKCWGHYPFTLKPFSFCLCASVYVCIHVCPCLRACVCVCVLPLPWKPSEPQGAVKNQYSSAALPLYSFNNSLPLHYCSTDLPSQGPDWHLCALLPHWSLM